MTGRGNSWSARSRLLALAALIPVVAAACAGAGSGSGGAAQGAGADAGPLAATCEGEPAPAERVEPSPGEDVPSALDDMGDAAFPAPLVDTAEIISGGPPPDGIPAIDEPTFLEACAVDWLGPQEPVVALEVNDEVRGYPVQVMTWHEIVNDVVGGVPVAATYCPLCNSAFAFDRRVEGRILDFGTSGRLYRSNLVMYDRQTESLWVQFTFEAVVGVMTGTRLESFPMQTVAWSDFREAHPDALVLSRQTGFDRDYGRNPYPGYDDVNTSPFLFEGEVDGRLAAKTRIVGIRRGSDAVAIVAEDLLQRRVLTVEVGGQEVVVFAKPGTASALDATSVGEGRDVGATGVFDPTVEGRRLTFEPAGDEFRDGETGSTWNILGEAVAGPLRGSELAPVEHDDSLWFAWATFEPGTRVLPE